MTEEERRRLEKELELLRQELNRALEEETLVEPPCWSDSQVVSPDELVPGCVYRAFGAEGQRGLLLLVSGVMEREKGVLYAETVDWPLRDRLYLRRMILCDVGILPYNNGRWNPANYLEVTGERPVSLEKLEEIQEEAHPPF